MERYIWSINMDQKIRVKEIREYKINFDSEANVHFVTAHGYGFGKGITIFGPHTRDESVTFVNQMTSEQKKSDCGAALFEV